MKKIVSIDKTRETPRGNSSGHGAKHRKLRDQPLVLVAVVLLFVALPVVPLATAMVYGVKQRAAQLQATSHYSRAEHLHAVLLGKAGTAGTAHNWATVLHLDALITGCDTYAETLSQLSLFAVVSNEASTSLAKAKATAEPSLAAERKARRTRRSRVVASKRPQPN